MNELYIEKDNLLTYGKKGISKMFGKPKLDYDFMRDALLLNNLEGILYISLKNTFQNGHFPEKHLAEWTLSRMCISLNVHFPECTFGQIDISPKTYFPEWTLSRMYILPNGHFPENLFSRIDTCQNVHLMLAIIIQDDEIELVF